MKIVRVLLIVLAIAATEVALAIFFLDVAATDFGAFYASGAAYVNGLPMYVATDRPNLNPPIVSVGLFALLALVPIGIAAKLWIACGVLSLVASLVALRRALNLSLETVITIGAILLITVPARHIWEEGQITWLLLYPMTRAWLSYREGHPLAAGLWLAPVIAAKPFFALLVLPLWSVPLVTAAGLGSLVLTLIGVALAGPAAWHGWLAMGRVVQWLNQPQNGAIWSVAARAVAPTPSTMVGVADVLPYLWLVGIVVLLVVLWSLLPRTGDGRWFAGTLLAVLVSPLGWVYYLPLALGPLVALWQTHGVSRAVTRVAIIALVVPIPIVLLLGRTTWLASLMMGSLYAWATLALLAATPSLPVKSAAKRDGDGLDVLLKREVGRRDPEQVMPIHRKARERAGGAVLEDRLTFPRLSWVFRLQ